MADVKKYTNQIAKAQKGRDVRDAIVNAINEVSDENNEYNQVKADILSAQSDIAEKVTKNEQTAQTFAVDVKKAEELKQGLDTDITQGTALKSQLDAAVETADTSKKNLDASNTTAGQTKTALDGSVSNAQTLKQSLDSDITQGTTLKTDLESDITQGTALKSQLDAAVETADTSKKNLDASNTAAGKTKTALDVSNTTATKTKTDLDASNATASETKTGLDATNKTAADLVASLGDKITEGTQVKTDIQTTGETAMSNLQAEAAKQQEHIKTSIDDTLSISGKAADAAVTGKKIDSLKEDLCNIISPNLYNPTDAKENTAINQDNGTEMSFDGWIATGYITVSKGEVLYFSSNNEPIAYSTGAFYDAQKKFISGFGNPNESNNITVTSDGYARFSFGTAPVNLQIEKGSRTTYVPYGELKVKVEVDNVKEDIANTKAEVTGIKAEVVKIQEDHTNLFNKNTVTKGAVLSENGYLETSFSSWDSSDYIPIKPGMILYFSSNELPIGVTSTGAYFDADKKYLSGINNEPTVLTVPNGAYYLRFSKNGGLGDILNTLKIEQHGITKFTPYGELYVTVNESALPNSILPKWKGLKILTLGDSITAMGGVNGWTHWIKQYLLADKVVNVSVAGSTWQDKVASQTYDGNPQPSTDGNVMGNQVQKVLNAKANGDADYQDFDVITFSFGTNDSVDFSVQTKESVENQFITNYAQNNFTVVPIDSVNRQTLAGAMRYGFQKLHEAYPNAVIFMCTPTQECYETFDSIYQKGDFINFIADRLGAETIDTRRCGIRNIYESQTTINYDHPEQSGTAPIQTDLLDGIHTNENGAKKIAKYNAREIMKYFMIN